MASIPLFLLTKHKTVDVIRRLPGAYVDGKWVDGGTETFQIEANVQPFNYKDELQLKESERARQWVKVYTATRLNGLEQGENGVRGDVIEWEGYQYQVMRVHNYSMTVLDHYKALCARLETTLEDSYPNSELPGGIDAQDFIQGEPPLNTLVNETMPSRGYPV